MLLKYKRVILRILQNQFLNLSVLKFNWLRFLQIRLQNIFYILKKIIKIFYILRFKRRYKKMYFKIKIKKVFNRSFYNRLEKRLKLFYSILKNYLEDKKDPYFYIMEKLRLRFNLVLKIDLLDFIVKNKRYYRCCEKSGKQRNVKIFEELNTDRL